MSIGKGKPPRKIVVIGGHVRLEAIFSGVTWGEAGHISHEIAPINAVLTHIQEDPGLDRAWRWLAASDVRDLCVDALGVRPRPAAVSPRGIRWCVPGRGETSHV